MEVAILFIMVIGLLLIGVPIAVSLGLSSMIFLLAAVPAIIYSMIRVIGRCGSEARRPRVAPCQIGRRRVFVFVGLTTTWGPGVPPGTV